ncbi:MAG TPA: sensor domain-containing protein [Pseudonocardiaceae bacterium]|nr:sensor domain-containing protein [Pseudonocardiaceae bacterium]
MATKRSGPGRLRAVGWSLALVLAVGLEGMAGIVLAIGVVLMMTGFGIWPASWALGWLRGLADLHRLWAARVMDTPIARPYRETPEGNALTRLQAYRADPATRRDLGWLAVDLSAGLLLAVIPAGLAFFTLVGTGFTIDAVVNFPHQGLNDHRGVPSALIFTVVAGLLLFFLTKPALRGYTWLQHWLLSPAETVRLSARINELTRSRDDAVDTQAAEIRRIERDLHDGAQARLVSLGMSLGLAEQLLAADPDAAQQLLAEAKESTGVALSELRELVRGIHPPILADRGLAGAAEALVLNCAIPVELSVNLPGRVPAPVESAMYFALTEVLTNMAKHSNATNAWIRISHENGRLGVMVGDNGRGGASMPEGGGLAGVARRLAGFDGIVMVASPIGGPTIVTMELPCQLAYALS